MTRARTGLRSSVTDIAQEIAAGSPGPVLAVDEHLRILASAPGAHEVLYRAAVDVRGRSCYEVLPLVDASTGRPCQDQCPLADGATRPGWTYSRVLEVDEPKGGRTRLDCLVLKCLTSDGEESNLCFLEPLGASTVESHAKVLQAIQSVYPAVSGPTDQAEVMSASLKAVLQTTGADGGELFLLDSETRELAVAEQQGLPAEAMQRFRRSAFGDGFPGMIERSRLPLLASGTWANDASEPSEEVSGWYLCAPLVAEGRVLGALAVASRRRRFDVAGATRVLFAVAAQLGAYLRPTRPAADSGDVGGPAKASVDGPRLRISCLGPFEVVLDGKPVPASRFQRFKALKLLKFLVAHRGRLVPRETLMEFLWPETDPARASGNLRVVLHALRRTLEPDLESRQASSFIVGQGDLVCLDPSGRAWVDEEEFVQTARAAARLASQGRIEEALAEYRAAASLYHGEYLEDEPYSDWCLFERERLKEVYINLMEQMTSIFRERGELSFAIDACRTILGVDQGREEAHRGLMLLLWTDGRREEALRQYETCRRILREELEMEPSRETDALYNGMLAGVYS